MPTIETCLSDLEKLLGVELPRKIDDLEDIFSYIKGEVANLEGDDINIEIKDSNRPDLWSSEGLTRSLKTFMGLEKPKHYSAVKDSDIDIFVSRELENIRPYIGCSVVKSVKLDDVAIKGMMHLQDKLDLSYGRGRKRTSIGLYDCDLIYPPIHYSVSTPNETSFIPLGFNKNLTLAQILERHPKGIEYGYIVQPYEKWPILKDSHNAVLSFPPIINSNDLGKITEETENILIEVTGASFKIVSDVLDLVSIALADRGGIIETVDVSYPYSHLDIVKTPTLERSQLSLQQSFIKEILGLELNSDEIIKLLYKAGFDAHSQNHSIQVDIPCFRKDILHLVDIVEEVAIAYGFNSIKPRWPQIQTFGGLTANTRFYDKVRELMIGYEFQEVLTFSLSNHEKLFEKMGLEHHPVIELENPKMATYTCLRNWLIPNLVDFLSHNTHVEYPQKIFEVGDCVKPDEKSGNGSKEWKSLAATLAYPQAGYTEIKGIVDSLLLNLGVKCQVKSTIHSSFIDGRVAEISRKGEILGLLGEVHPQILQNWGLEVPIATFELNLTTIGAMYVDTFT